MHSSALIIYLPSPSVMQLQGQTSAHAPQAMQSSVILKAISVTSEILSSKRSALYCNIKIEFVNNYFGQFCIKELLDKSVSVKMFLALMVVAGAFVVLIARSGHTAGMPVSGAEIKIRAMLEQLFYARPRSKEIFFGHPAFILAISAFLKKFPKMICFILILAATIGQSSMVETFAHMRTPIFMSFMRGLDGLIPGAIIGAVLIIVLQIFMRGLKKE